MSFRLLFNRFSGTCSLLLKSGILAKLRDSESLGSCANHTFTPAVTSRDSKQNISFSYLKIQQSALVVKTETLLLFTGVL